MSFNIHDSLVSCCGDCPRNKAWPNELYDHWLMKHLLVKDNLLPPTHRCEASLDTVFLNKKGRLILNPLAIPDWCPYDNDKP